MKILLLLFIVFTNAAAAQNLADAVRPLRSGRMLPMTADGKLIGASNPDIEGSPFFDTVWNNTNLSLPNGEVYRGIKTKLDIFNNHLRFIDEKGNEMYLEANELQRIEYTDWVKKDSVLHSFNVYANRSGKKEAAAFYEVLSEGGIKLVKLLRKHIEENTNSYTREMTKAFVVSGDLFVFANNTLMAVKRKESFWQELMQPKWSAVQDFVAKNNLGFKATADLQKIVHYFNTAQ